MRSLFLPSIFTSLAWIIAVLIINPTGEFMVNDDWSFVKILEVLLSEGRLIATGWGKGGPSAIIHVLWGGLFTYMTEFSLTALRLSVLTIGISGSFGLLLLLRLTGVSPWVSLLGTLTLVFNPLFLSQSFTFMTDITFASIVVFSFLLLHLGMGKSRFPFIIIGLLFALAAILVRQIGMVVPLGLVVTCFLHTKGRELGRFKMLLLVVFITVIPWLAYEFFLSRSGSTPLTQHEVIHNILDYPLSKGFLEYVYFLSSQLLTALSYACFLVSPVLAPRFIQDLRKKNFRIFFIVLTTVFLLIELGIITGTVNPPTQFYRNVIFDFGIGPILLKDTYILGIQRTANIPTCLFYFLAYWATLSMAVVTMCTCSAARCLLNSNYRVDSKPINFTAIFSFITALIYIGIILLTGFHDRYLIPVCIFFLVWLSPKMSANKDFQWSAKSIILSVIPLVFMTSFGLLGTRDFMEMKRSLTEAHNYLVKELNVEPCSIDGGFEFNGYHCYKNNFKPRESLSWWWVTKEDYLITLGPLQGYGIVRTFPFDRFMGPDGAVHILQPMEEGNACQKKIKSAG